LGRKVGREGQWDVQENFVGFQAPWSGRWTPLGRENNGKFALTVESTTAVIVRIRAVGR
jgi:hypothetical protein